MRLTVTPTRSPAPRPWAASGRRPCASSPEQPGGLFGSQRKPCIGDQPRASRQRHSQRRGAAPQRAVQGREAPAASEEEEEPAPDVEALLEKVANLVATSHQLVPYDPGLVNKGLVVWCAPRRRERALRDLRWHALVANRQLHVALLNHRIHEL